MKILYLLMSFLLCGCVRLPAGIEPVQNFDLQRYLGIWYEIARLDHSFERGLSRVTAEYSLLENGSVRVINRGYDQVKDRWKTAEGKARFVQSSGTGYLQVSFFGPFYGSYVIMELDQNDYQYALVCGPNKKYLWLLARRPDLDAATRNMLIDRARDLGFAVDELIFVHHS
ncbi:MAG: lipocalin family protein [Desulforhopalus sp.]